MSKNMVDDNKSDADIIIGDSQQSHDELAVCQQKAEEYLNGWKRAQADFINYKKDETKRMSEFAQFANSALILDFLEVLDIFDSALRYTPEELKTTQKAWWSGLNHGIKQIQNFLEKHGVRRIEVQDKAFDPEIHEMVETGQELGDKEGKLEEVRAGYKLNDKVIRPARVQIIKK